MLVIKKTLCKVDKNGGFLNEEKNGDAFNWNSYP